MNAQRVSSELVSLYTFHEGSGSVVHDVSGFGVAEDLYIDDTNQTTWLSGGGLSIDGNTILKTSAPAVKQYNALAASPEMTFEFWVTQEEDNQSGPARIMTYSANTAERNYTVGQESYDYVTRVKTDVSDANGFPESDADINIDENLQHVVYTINSSGTEKWYVNGVLTDEDYRSGSWNAWNSGYHFALANEMTLDRPWIGDFHLVAVYCQVLDQNEVLQNYNEGPNQNQTVCETITNGSSPYPDSDPLFQQVIAADSYCCNTWWDNICQTAYDELDTDNGDTDSTCELDGYATPGGRVFWIPEYGTDFKASDSGLSFEQFDNGTAHMSGQVERISNSNHKFSVDLWFTNKSTYTEWIAQGMAAKNPNLGDESAWIFYQFDTNESNTLIGQGSLSGTTLYLTDTPDQYALQMGDGANALNSNINGLSTWFNYTGTSSGSGDINGTTNCGVDIIEDWSYGCEDGKSVEIIGEGIKNNVPNTLSFSDANEIDHVVIEVVYKGCNPGGSIYISDATGNQYQAFQETPSDAVD